MNNKLSYIELINDFWKFYDESKSLTTSDITLYFVLLRYCNKLNWLNPFSINPFLMSEINPLSVNTYYKSLKHLNDLKLIKWEKGKHNVSNQLITIIKINNSVTNSVTNSVNNSIDNSLKFSSVNSVVNNNKTIIQLDNNTNEKSKKDFSGFSNEIINLSKRVIKLFPAVVINNLTNKQKYEWVDILRKLNEIDKLSINEIEKIINFGRSSDFWRKNFLSILKLRKTNRDGVKYYIVFKEQMKENQTDKKTAIEKTVFLTEEYSKEMENEPDRLRF